MPEKCTRQLPPVRVPESLEMGLLRLAARDDRSLSEYIKLTLSRHVFGHAPTVDALAEEGKEWSA